MVELAVGNIRSGRPAERLSTHSSGNHFDRKISRALGGQPFRWPAGTYVSNSKFDHIMMAMETSITKDGVTYKEVAGTPAEQEELEKSYEHLCKLRDEVIEMGIIPAIKDWHALNPNID